MKMVDVKARAKLFGIKTRQKKKGDLIREIQRAEGNFDCFGTAREYCDQEDCCFREDCLPTIDPKRGGDL
jgi:hypothetical protein